MKNNPLPRRLDVSPDIGERLLPYRRLRLGDVWRDDIFGHWVACFDAIDASAIHALMGSERAKLAIHDSPHSLTVFELRSIGSLSVDAKTKFRLYIPFWTPTHRCTE